ASQAARPSGPVRPAGGLPGGRARPRRGVAPGHGVPGLVPDRTPHGQDAAAPPTGPGAAPGGGDAVGPPPHRPRGGPTGAGPPLRGPRHPDPPTRVDLVALAGSFVRNSLMATTTKAPPRRRASPT